jgi:hypothetical protein
VLTPVTILPQRQQLQLDLELVELAPMERAAIAKPAKVRAPRQAIVTLKPTGDGKTVQPMLETHSSIVNVKAWDEKVYGVSRFVIRALVLAGFVEGEMIAPRSLTINLESWFAHRERMRENPYFWTNEDNRRRYSEAAAQVNRQHPQDRSKKAREGENAPDEKDPASAPDTRPGPQTPRRGSAGAKEGHSGG